jgi:hypothetical protein
VNGRNGILLLILVLCLLLGKHLWLAQYAHPAADDYCYAAKARGMTLWAWSVEEYQAWNGRYASNPLMARGPLMSDADGLFAYRTVPVLLFGLTFLGAWALIRALTRSALRIREQVLGSLLYLGLYIGLMPALGEGFYWYTGAITYQLTHVLVLFLGAVLLWSIGAAGRTRPVTGVGIAALLTVVICGMNEQHMLLTVAGYILLAARAWRKRRGTRWTWTLLLSVACLCGCIVLFAPGNAVRAQYFEGTHRFWSSAGMTVLQTGRFTGQWLLSPALWALTALYLSLHHRLRIHVPLLAQGFHLRPITALSLLLGATALCVFPAYWSMGMLAQHRTLNVACSIWIPLWFVFLAAWLEHPSARPITNAALIGAPARWAWVVALIGIGFLGNAREAWGDLLTGRAQRYDAAMQEREADLRAGRGTNTTVVLHALQDPPRTLCPVEESRPDQRWMTDCTARYFGLEEDRLRMATGR